MLYINFPSFRYHVQIWKQYWYLWSLMIRWRETKLVTQSHKTGKGIHGNFEKFWGFPLPLCDCYIIKVICIACMRDCFIDHFIRICHKCCRGTVIFFVLICYYSWWKCVKLSSEEIPLGYIYIYTRTSILASWPQKKGNYLWIYTWTKDVD